MARKSTKSLSKKLDLILKREEQVLAKEAKIEREELKEEHSEQRLESMEQKTLSEIKELEQLEINIKEQIKDHPLKKIGARDLMRGLAGAFVGVIIHNALYYGTAIASKFDNNRAIIWFVLAFIAGAVILYATGYRKIEDKKTLWVLPIRLIILYTAALVVSTVALFLYYPGFGLEFAESMHLLAAVQMSAVIGAVTADMLGRD